MTSKTHSTSPRRYFPSSRTILLAEPLVLRGSDAWDRKCVGLEELVPSNPNRPYDMREVIKEIVDEGRLSSYQSTMQRML